MQITAIVIEPIVPTINPAFLNANGITRIPVPKQDFMKFITVENSLEI